MSSRTLSNSQGRAVWGGGRASSGHQLPPTQSQEDRPGQEGALHSPRLPAGTGAQVLKIPRSLPAWVSIYPKLQELFLSLPSNLILAIYSNACVFGGSQGGLYYGLEYFWEVLVSRSDAGVQLGKASANRVKITPEGRPAGPRRRCCAELPQRGVD